MNSLGFLSIKHEFFFPSCSRTMSACLKGAMNSFSLSFSHYITNRYDQHPSSALKSQPLTWSQRQREERERGQTPSDELYSICQLSVDRLLEVPKGPGSLKIHPYTPNQSLIYGIIRCNSFTLCAHVTMSHNHLDSTCHLCLSHIFKLFPISLIAQGRGLNCDFSSSAVLGEDKLPRYGYFGMTCATGLCLDGFLPI